MALTTIGKSSKAVAVAETRTKIDAVSERRTKIVAVSKEAKRRIILTSLIGGNVLKNNVQIYGENFSLDFGDFGGFGDVLVLVTLAAVVLAVVFLVVAAMLTITD